MEAGMLDDADPTGQPASKHRKIEHAYRHQPDCVGHPIPISNNHQPSRFAGLEVLPAEILSIILDLSAEASLIHTCQRIRQRLPSFVFASKRLLLQAVVPLAEDSNIGHLPEADDEVGAAVAGLTPDRQREVRDAVFSSHWLELIHVQAIHKQLLRRRIFQAYKACGLKGPSRGQAQRVRQFLSKQSLLTRPDELVLRLRDQDSQLRQLIATRSEIGLYQSGRVLSQSKVRLPIFELDGLIPDFLLRQPIESDQIYTIRWLFGLQHVYASYASNSYDLGRLSTVVGRAHPSVRTLRCNEDLLAEAILESICADQKDKFIFLMAIECRLKGISFSIDQRHIECAVLCGRSRMLIRILRNRSYSTTQTCLSEEYLLGLINRAKAEVLPNWLDTSRILAMEVAVNWKMKEAQKNGFEVTRLFHMWPPALNIRDPRSRQEQSWFIPRDGKFELDWEESTPEAPTGRTDDRIIKRPVPGGFAVGCCIYLRDG